MTKIVGVDSALRRAADWYFPGDRLVADVGLSVAALGASVPFGLHNLDNYSINGWEIALAALSFIAWAGLTVDILHPKIGRVWPYLVATFVWAWHSAYAAFLPGAVAAARVYLALLFLSWALLAGGAWRVAVTYRDRVTGNV